jgi:phosphatidylglycerol:prolipoprotein diacylglycerol transferase
MVPDPVLFRIGPLTVYWYGVLIVSGAMLAAQLASWLSRRNGHNPEIAWNMLLVLLLAGILGGRIYHILSSWDYYRLNPGEMFGVQMSGFGIYGSVIAGLAALWVYARVHKLHFPEWTDYIAPGLLLAQAIGRWGNFFNSELYGDCTTLPWGVYIAPGNRLEWLADCERFHPTFFYESGLNFIGAMVLLYLAWRWKKGRLWGDIFYLYGMVYPAIRFFIEQPALRPDAYHVETWMVAGLPMARLISIIAFVFFGTLLVVRHRLRRPNMIYVPGEPWQEPAPAAVEPGDGEAPSSDTAD